MDFRGGILESVTAEEKAEVDSLDTRHKETVEPLTNYFVARAQQDINKGNTLVGGMFTATHRKIETENLNWLHTEAYSGGLDATHNWKERTYYVSAKALMSYVKGSEEAILTTQTSSERYFQRPDNHHADVDSTRTSLNGTGGNLMFGKRNGDFVFDIGYNWSSPELELNDIGFLVTDRPNVAMGVVWLPEIPLNPKHACCNGIILINTWNGILMGRLPIRITT
jgi:hypothetical protein